MRLFQFDYDLTFAVLFLHPDKTILARYGTRSGHDADKDVAIEGLAATMEQVLKLHQDFSDHVSSLAGLQPQPIEQSIPEDFPSLSRFKPSLDYDGQVAKSCIHCHQVRDAARLEYRKAGEAIPEKLLFPYPPPTVFGLHFDKSTTTSISSVEPDSVAARSGLLTGDHILKLNDTLVSSEADVHWLLHNLPDDACKFDLELLRGEERKSLAVSLPDDWRKLADIAWRPTSWDLRRMSTGGLTLQALSEAAREELGIEPSKMALLASHVGKYGQHARARRAGIRENDVIISFDGRDDLHSENAVIEHAVQNRRPGDRVEIKYLRNAKMRRATISLQ